MTVAQTKAARRKWRNDGRYKPKKGLRGGGSAGMSKSARLAEAKNRKRTNRGQAAGSVGYKVK